MNRREFAQLVVSGSVTMSYVTDDCLASIGATRQDVEEVESSTSVASSGIQSYSCPEGGGYPGEMDIHKARRKLRDLFREHRAYLPCTRRQIVWDFCVAWANQINAVRKVHWHWKDRNEVVHPSELFAPYADLCETPPLARAILERNKI